MNINDNVWNTVNMESILQLFIIHITIYFIKYIILCTFDIDTDQMSTLAVCLLSYYS